MPAKAAVMVMHAATTSRWAAPQRSLPSPRLMIKVRVARGPPQCGQSRCAASCGSGAGGGPKALTGLLVRSTSLRAAAVRLHSREQ